MLKLKSDDVLASSILHLDPSRLWHGYIRPVDVKQWLTLIQFMQMAMSQWSLRTSKTFI